MNKVIKFDNVSKKYRLGLSRTGLPSLVSRWLKNPIKRSLKRSDTDAIIWAVRDVSFDVESGQSLALIGPNGAGKTTILKLISRITRPTMGTITTHGRLSALIELGAGFHPDLTGRENIHLNGALLGMTKGEIAQRFDEIVAFSELEEFLDTPLKRYSSGMAVRLGFSVASCIDPEILLVDEVLAVGDQSFRQKCVKRIRDLVNDGTSIIFVSHNLWLIQAVCSSAIYIDRGQVIYSGNTSEAIGMYDRNINERRAREFDQNIMDQPDSRSEIDITNIEIQGKDNLPNGDLRNDRMAEIRIYYTSSIQIGVVNIVIRIVRSDGLTCCMLRSKLDNVQISIGPGTGVVCVVLNPLQLYGGTYFVHALIRDETDAESIATGGSSSFYVAGSALSHQTMNGVYEPNREWKQNSPSTSSI